MKNIKSYNIADSMRDCALQSRAAMEACSEALLYCMQHNLFYLNYALVASLVQCIQFCKMNYDFLLRQRVVNMHAVTRCREKCLAVAKVCVRLDQDIFMMCRNAVEQCALMCTRIEEPTNVV